MHNLQLILVSNELISLEHAVNEFINSHVVSVTDNTDLNIGLYVIHQTGVTLPL